MSHTKGLLTDKSIDGSKWGIYDSRGWCVAQAQQMHVISSDPLQKERTANTRRLAACWNACDNIPTTALELEPKLEMFGLVENTLQRDQLLEAIERIAVMASRDGKDIYHDMRVIRMLAINTALKAKGEAS